MRRSFDVEGKEVYIGATVGIAHAARRRAGPRRAAAQRRPRDVPRQEGRRQPRRDLRGGDAHRAAGAHRARGRPAPRARARRAVARLPARGRAADRPARRRRGARALDASDPRADPAADLHPGGRGDRPHRRHRALGPARGLPPARRVAPAGPRAGAQRQPVGACSCATTASPATSSRRCCANGLPGTALTLEITESMLLSGDEDTAARLRRLKALGAVDRRRRLRHGLLVAELPQAVPGRRAEDRQELRRHRRVAARRTARWRGRSSSSAAACAWRRSPRASRTVEQLEQLRMLDCQLGQGYHFSHPARRRRADRLPRSRRSTTSAARRSRRPP